MSNMSENGNCKLQIVSSQAVSTPSDSPRSVASSPGTPAWIRWSITCEVASDHGTMSPCSSQSRSSMISEGSIDQLHEDGHIPDVPKLPAWVKMSTVGTVSKIPGAANHRSRIQQEYKHEPQAGPGLRRPAQPPPFRKPLRRKPKQRKLDYVALSDDYHVSFDDDGAEEESVDTQLRLEPLNASTTSPITLKDPVSFYESSESSGSISLPYENFSGAMLGQSLRLKTKVSENSYGDVYLAEDLSTGHLVKAMAYSLHGARNSDRNWRVKHLKKHSQRSNYIGVIDQGSRKFLVSKIIPESCLQKFSLKSMESTSMEAQEAIELGNLGDFPPLPATVNTLTVDESRRHSSNFKLQSTSPKKQMHCLQVMKSPRFDLSASANQKAKMAQVRSQDSAYRQRPQDENIRSPYPENDPEPHSTIKSVFEGLDLGDAVDTYKDYFKQYPHIQPIHGPFSCRSVRDNYYRYTSALHYFQENSSYNVTWQIARAACFTEFHRLMLTRLHVMYETQRDVSKFASTASLLSKEWTEWGAEIKGVNVEGISLRARDLLKYLYTAVPSSSQVGL